MMISAKTTTSTISPILNGNPHGKNVPMCIPCQDSAQVRPNSKPSSRISRHDTISVRTVEADTLVGWKKTAATTVSTSAKENPSQLTKPRVQPPVLISCLKRRGASNSTSTSQGRRRVSGLWNPTCCCLFSHLHNDTMTNILSFLNLRDLLASSQVCRRWKHVAALPTLWQDVDATEFVQATFEQYSKQRKTKDASVATSQALQDYLHPYANRIKSLTICSIAESLDANTFLPNITSSLQQLTLSGFTNLTDTHIQVMFLSTKQQVNLHTLVLNDCLLLTNATLDSISRHAPQLQSLSVRKCRNISSIQALQNVWDIATTDATSTTATTSSLQSLFAPRNTAPCPPPASQQQGGKLRRLDICGTSVTGPALVESLHAVKGKVRLQELCTSNGGWNDLLLLKLAHVVEDESSLKHVKFATPMA